MTKMTIRNSNTSLRGSDVPWDQLADVNQNAIAISGGGLAMNARGDQIGPSGEVIKTAEEIQQQWNDKIEKTTNIISMSDSEKFKNLINGSDSQTVISEEEKAELEEKKANAKKAAKRVELGLTELANSTKPLEDKSNDQ